jgi:RNA polymerase sigma-70 factor (ECF subfamily)
MELEAFKIEVIPLRGRLLDLSLAIVGGEADAEDVVQEALLKLWHMRERLDAYRSVEALAVAVTRNLALDRLRSHKPGGSAEDFRTIGSKDGNPEELLERQDAVDSIRRLIERLPSLQQAIIRMKDIEGYEVEEIAAITGCRADAVRVNLSRARKKIKEQFIALNKNIYDGYR